MVKTKEPTQAKAIWDCCITQRNFTADMVAEETGVDVQTVRHYFCYWKDKGTMEQTGKVDEQPGKRGRPRLLWACKGRKFKAVWR